MTAAVAACPSLAPPMAEASAADDGSAAPPLVRYRMADQVKKGEDFFLAKRECRHGALTFGVYGIFDGHNGTPAAMFARDKLMSFILEQLPEDAEPEAMLDALPQALAEGFLKCHNSFAMKGISSGSTATVAIVSGWTVTVAGVGDSRAILDTVAGGVIPLSIDHRFEDNPDEQRRVLKEGGQLSRLRTFEGIELGPLRSWPGGLCVSRSIGDVDCGPLITPLPHVKQIRVPPTTGGRIIIASDGVWDAISSEKVAKCTRGLATSDAAPLVVKEAIKAKGLRDDTTVLVLDLLPPSAVTADKNACPVPKQPSSTKRFLARFKSKKRGEMVSATEESEEEQRARMPHVVNEQDSMHGSNLYERYKNISLHMEGNFCAVCGNQVDITVAGLGGSTKGDVSVRAGNLLCPKHRGMGAELGLTATKS